MSEVRAGPKRPIHTDKVFIAFKSKNQENSWGT